MNYIAIENFSSSKKGKLLVTEAEVLIKKGDNYIGEGFSGLNVFSWQTDARKIAKKVVAVSKDFEGWGWSGNNTLKSLPIIDI